ncbi:RTX toxins and related Ca2+-binding proteins [Zymobacter palmae]|uniref:RTX toxins and related Ca2+-binding proteins n=1 Tax=Zymobacter palmae TaxID=33074 RepID=A0A348HDK9_9GAMM|nr:RTX toxins and related Ca2+-binding proteins [Zymobacter palmae]
MGYEGFVRQRKLKNEVAGLHHAAHATHVACRSSNFFRIVCYHGFGSDHQTTYGTGRLQRRARYFSRVKNAHFEHVAIFASGSVVAEVAFACFNVVDHNGGFFTCVGNDLTQRCFERTQCDLDTVSLFVVIAFQVFQLGQNADQSSTTARYDAFFDGSASRVQRIFNACFLLFHFDFGRCADTDNGNTACQFGNAFLQFFAVVVRRSFFDLGTNLSNACFDVCFNASAVDDRSGFFGHGNATSSTQVFYSSLFKRQTDFFRDNRTTCQDSDILQHGFTAITEARCFGRSNLDDTAHVVHHQSGQRFAFDVFGDDHQRFACFGNGFQYRQQFADIGDFFVDQQQVRVFEFDGHGVLVSHEVRRQVTTIELHTFDDFQLVFEATAFINSDDAFFTHFLHRFSDDGTDSGVAIGGDCTNLSDGFGIFARYGQRLDFGNGSQDGFVDTAFQVHRVHARDDTFQAFIDDSLSQNGCRSSTVTGSVGGFGSDFLDHLSAHVFELIFQFDFLSNGNTVFGDGRSAEGFFQNDVATFRPQSRFDGISKNIDTASHALARVIGETDLFSRHVVPTSIIKSQTVMTEMTRHRQISLRAHPECRFRS